MTVQTTTSSQSFLGDGTTTGFPFSFKFEATTDVYARYVNPDGSYTQLAAFVDFTLTPAPGNVGGTITTSVAVPLGTTLQIYRLVALTQLLDLNPFDQLPADAIEQRFDLVYEALQQMQDQISGVATGTVGGITSVVNLGGLGTFGLFAALAGGTAQFKSLAAGANVTLTDLGAALQIDVATTPVGVLLAANNLADVASRQTALDTLLATSTATNEYVLTKDTATGQAKWKVVPTGASGEANTMSNLGAGAQIYKQKVGVDLQIRTLTAGANITLTQNANDITIGAAAAGEANVGSNIGVAGQGWYASKSGVALQFKGHAAGTGIAISSNATDLTTRVDTSQSLTWAGHQNFIGPYADPGLPGAVANPGSFADVSARIVRQAPVGTAGLIQSALFVGTKIPSNNVNFAEWTQFIGVDDSSNSGQNVGLYVGATRQGNSHLWGAVFDVSDKAGHSGTGNMYGIELSILQDSTSLAARRVLIGAFYGSRSGNVASKHTGGFLIRPFDGLAQLGYGVSIEIGKVDQSFLSTAIGQSAFAAGGSYSTAAVDTSTMTSTPVALLVAAGSTIRWNSGASSNGGANWFPGAFAPAFVGAVRIFVDGSTLYLPVCSNHP